jgi:hypothetical protein
VVFQPTLTILEPEPFEVTRQIMLAFHRRYAAIKSLEFITSISNRKASNRTLNRFSSRTASILIIGTAHSLAKGVIGDVTIEAEIWDTAGQEKYRSRSSISLKLAMGCAMSG